MRHPLEEQITKTIARHQLIGASDIIYIALSGGADSVALLRAMLALGYKERLRALHMNFQLRGEESQEDEAFVRQLCQEQAIPLLVERRDTSSYAKAHGISIEMAARDLRYAWFASVRAQEADPMRTKILVAHHADDQLETFFLNLSMGTGIRGLRGMRYYRPGQGIIRPLLDCPRTLILGYLQALGQAWREDSSNADISYKRNHIRHQLLPLLEELNPSFRSVLVRTMGHLRSTEVLYLELIAQYRERLMTESVITITPLTTHPEGKTLLFELLYPYGFSREIVEEVYRNILSGAAGAQFYAPNYLLHRGSQHLELLPRNIEKVTPFSISIRKDGSCLLPTGQRLAWRVYPASTWQSKKLPRHEACFDLDSLATSELTLRSRKESDMLYPFGMRGKKLLRRIFIDGKYSQQARREALLLCLSDQPIWLVGHVADRRYAVNAETKQIIHFTLSSPSERLY